MTKVLRGYAEGGGACDEGAWRLCRKCLEVVQKVVEVVPKCLEVVLKVVEVVTKVLGDCG